MNALRLTRAQQFTQLMVQPNRQNLLPSLLKNKHLTYINKYNIISTVEYEKEKPKLSKIRGLLKEFMLLMVEGTKEAYKDSRWLVNTHRKKSYRKFTGFELREQRRILYDMFKFLPFSTFLIIPGLEFFLPFYLLYFPNSIPTWYIFDHAWDSKIESLEMKQKDAHSVLIHYLRDFLLTKDEITPEDFLDENKYKSRFMKYSKDIDKKLNITNFTSDELIQVGKFLGMDYMTGTYCLSTTIRMVLNTPRYLVNAGLYLAGSKSRWEHEHWIFNHQFKLNVGPLEYLKRGFLRYQITRHIETLRKQDIGFFKYGMQDIQGHQITDFARERGITTISCYETLKVFMQNDWVSICLKFSNNQLIWYAIMQYDFLEHANKEFN